MRVMSLGQPSSPDLIWMMYLGLRVHPGLSVSRISPEAFGTIVQGLDAGMTVHIYGDDHPAVNEMADAARAMAGGWHA